MPDNDVEMGESVEVTEVITDDGQVLGTIVDDVVVITAEDGSIVDETVDVFDAEGNLIAEEETIDVYDADGQLIAEAETIVALED